jgi:DNA repair protein RadC
MGVIREMADDERPREAMALRGAGALADAELVAVIVGSGIKGKNAVELGRELLVRFGGAGRLLSASLCDLRRVKGLGLAKAAKIAAACELARRAMRYECAPKDAVRSPQDVRRLIQMRLAFETVEVFLVLYLDRRNRVLAAEEAARGTVDKAHVYPREIVRRALDLGAACLIVAHNHPSGGARPSPADIEVTRMLKAACGLFEIDLHDHVIVAAEEAVCSMRESGYW